MKKLLFSLCAFVQLLSGVGCEKVIEFTGEQTEPRLTLSSQAEVGEVLEAFVSASVFFLSETRNGLAFVEGLNPERGQVRCYVNGATTPHLLQYVPRENANSLRFRASDYAPATISAWRRNSRASTRSGQRLSCRCSLPAKSFRPNPLPTAWKSRWR